MRSLLRAALALASMALCSTATPARAADPTTVDCLSASNSSIGLRREHKLRKAREHLLVCTATSCPADVRKECIRRVEEINAAIPTVVFEVKDSAGNDLGNVKLTMDGQPLSDSLEGTALSIDPGTHLFTFEAPGQPAVQKQLVIVEGQKERHEQVVLGRPEAAAAAPSPPPPRDLTNTPTEQAAATPRSHALGWSLLGGGAAVGFASLVFMLVEAGKAADANNSHDQNDYNSAASGYTVGLIGALVGAAAVAGGTLVLVSSSPSPSRHGERAAVRIDVGPRALRVEGTW